MWRILQKRITYLLAIVIMLLALPIPVSANNPKYKFTKVNTNISYSWGNFYFVDGMHLAYLGVGDYVYITKEGKVVKPHPNIIGTSYSDGLTPIFDKKKGLGYIDTTGKVVIPMGLNAVTTKEGELIYAGNFVDGYALVYKGSGYDGNPYLPELWYTIDKTGKKVNVEVSTDTLAMYQGYPYNSEWETVNIHGEEVRVFFNEGLALGATNQGMDYWVIERTDYVPPKKEAPVQQPKTPDPKPEVPVQKPKAPEKPIVKYTNLSNLTFTSWIAFDNGHGINYKITNNTNNLDSGRYCLIVDGYHAEVHFIDYDNLGPGESIYGTIHTQTDGSLIISKEVKTYIANFDNSKEREDFETSIPWKVWAPEEDGMRGIDYCVDSGNEGKKWLKDNVGIIRN